MIYECPNCHAPQAAGNVSCRECGAEFDGPVPEDAILPAGTAATAPPHPGGARPAAPEAEAVEVVGGPHVVSVESVAPSVDPLPAASHVEEVRPPEPAFVPYQDTPAGNGQAPPAYQSPLPAYQPPPAYAPPAYAPPPYTAPAASPRRGGGFQKALLIGLPILIALVLGGVFLVRGLDSDSEAPPAPSAPTAPPPAPPAPAAPVSPTTLNGSMNGSGDAVDPKAKVLIGRWQNKKTDFYVFNGNGTGYRGSTAGQQPQEAFVWVLTQNQLTLYADKKEKLALTPGPTEDTIYLRDEAGRYIQYAKAST